ncbi:hypothetical protein ACFVYG_08795 [Streptomyces sp. NPDC058256]|uniref:hypothetical protein n=1 Tax=Streptomyces sp. NPDC058256 TaxID=3346408 RepID=UPI0036E59624
MSSSTTFQSLKDRLSTATWRVLRRLAHDDRGSTTENVIWIAFLAGLALAVTTLYGPQILAAARSTVFK